MYYQTTTDPTDFDRRHLPKRRALTFPDMCEAGYSGLPFRYSILSTVNLYVLYIFFGANFLCSSNFNKDIKEIIEGREK